jgi:Holliday junction DNA helicase RuvB
MTGDGPYATTIQLGLKPFTLVGATTRTGLLTAPLSRASATSCASISTPSRTSCASSRAARASSTCQIDPGGAREIAARSRGTPRVANRLLRRVRDFAEVLGTGTITEAIARTTAERLEIDSAGLDEMDRRLLW